jgi:hypothetical protein
MFDDSFHPRYRTVVFLLTLTTGTPVHLFRLSIHGGCYWSADAAYSSVESDPTFAFVGSLCFSRLDFVYVFLDCDYV